MESSSKLLRSVRLIYWIRSPECDPPEDCQNRYVTQLADQRVDFVRDLPDEAGEARNEGMPLRLFPRAPAPAPLVQLAIESGRYSRFRRDPHFPSGAFERLYQFWIDRSTRGEIADATIVASSASENDEVLGMANCIGRRVQGRVGLIAVCEERAARARRGFDAGAHRHMALRDVGRPLPQLETSLLAASIGRCGYTIGKS